MYKLFDAHSDIFEDVDEKRARGLKNIIRDYHKDKWLAGGCVGGFYPVWVDPYCEVYSMPVEEQAERIIGHMKEELAVCTDEAVLVTSASEYEEAVSANKHAIFTGAEGLSFLRGDFGKLDELYELGMREFSLTWNEANEFAGGAGSAEGLTDAGRKCVKKIQSMGAILDLAHSSKQTFYDAASIAEGPFMVSHANVSHICNHPRNLTDDQLKIIADSKGMLGISAYSPFLSEYPAKQNVATLCDHIEYAAEKMGIECVGLGFDLVDFLDDVGVDESISYVTAGLSSISHAQSIAAELEKRGFSAADINKVYSENFLSLIERVIG